LIHFAKDVPEDEIQVDIWTKRGCSACTQAKQFFYSRKIPFNEHKLSNDPRVQMYFQQQTNNAKTVPQIIINGNRIGGFDDLLSLEKKGKISQIIQPQSPSNKFSFFKRRK